MPRYLTRREVSGAYPINYSTLAHMAMESKGSPYARIGKKAIYKVVDVERSIERRKLYLFQIVLILGVLMFAPEVIAATQLVWYQYGVASAAGGFDFEKNRTLFNRWYIVAYGPDSVEREAKSYVQNCAKTATIAAVEAFKDTPTPEISAHVAAARASFQANVQTCLSLRSFTKAYASKFEIGYIRRALWVDGLNLKFDAESPTAQNYRMLHNEVKDKLPEPLNKIIMFYIESQDFRSIYVRFTLPKEETRFLAQLPDPQKLRDMQKRFEEEGKELGKRIAKEIKEEAEKGVRSAREAVENFGRNAGEYLQRAAEVPIKLTSSSLDEANWIIAAHKYQGSTLLAPTVAGLLGTKRIGDAVEKIDLRGATIVPSDPQKLSEAEARKRFQAAQAEVADKAELPVYRPKETRKKKGYSTGTGFFITDEGHLLTNWHVVAEAKEIAIVIDGQLVPAKLLKQDPANDVALLKVLNVQKPSIALTLVESSETRRGEEVFTLGFPLVKIQEQEQKASFGKVNSLSGIKDDVRFLQIDVPIQPGNSGGPLFDKQGRVVGIVTATIDQFVAVRASGSIRQNVNYAVKIDYVLPVLRGLVLVDASSPQVGHISDLIDQYESSVILVVAR